MNINVIKLTQELVSIKSVSQWSNAEISDFLEKQLHEYGFEVERLQYVDENGEIKVSLVAKKGQGVDGLAFISHSDTVPGQEEDWPAFTPEIEGGRLLGRGSCDMKGPLAATIAAATAVDAAQLKKPIYIVVAADEEIGGGGARQIAAESTLFTQAGPKYGVIAEPTQLIPVYAHKGGCQVTVTAYGQAAHTSTDSGISANFLIAPFLAEMAELAQRLKTDESFRNYEFQPPTPGFNMTLDDGGTKINVTAAKTICRLGFRPMPNDRTEDIKQMIIDRARAYGFETSVRQLDSFYTPPQAEIVQVAQAATGGKQPETVPFGTDAFHLQRLLSLVVLGPGNIAQAHTVGEWLDIAQLTEAVDIYRQMIKAVCL
jgi:acetylornithine deacetylase